MENSCARTKRSFVLELLTELGIKDNEKLTIMDRRAITHYSEVTNGSLNDIIDQFMINIASRDHYACEKLSLKNIQATGDYWRSSFCSEDILYVILSQSDPFLLQDILRKLTLCENAIPVLLPDYDGTGAKFLLWGLRKSSRLYETSNATKEISFLRHRFLSISVLRMGNTAVPIYDILNTICATLKGFSVSKQFRPFQAEISNTSLGDGIVESFWLVDSFDQRGKKLKIPVCITNIRGDANNQLQQKQFCASISGILIVFAEIENMWKELNELFQRSKASHFILASSLSQRVLQIPPTKKVKQIVTASLSDVDLSNTILIKLFKMMKKCTVSKPLEEQDDLCKTLNIAIDEDASHCTTAAKLIANEMIIPITKMHEDWKNEYLFPLVTLQEKWELSFPDLRNPQSTLRKDQCKHALSDFAIQVISTILEDEEEGLYLILWLEMMFKLMDKNSTGAAKNEQYESRSSVSSDMILAELQQVVECSKAISNTAETAAKSFAKDPRIFAQLLLHGHSLHLIHNKSHLIPAACINQVFTALHELTEGKRIKVVSILGGHKSGKSKLLNQLFGVQFPEGKDSHGLEMHLVPVKAFHATESRLDFLLIIDTEGLKQSTKESNNYSARGCFVSMLTVTLSELVIVHLCSRQSLDEMQTVINIFVESLSQTNSIPTHSKFIVVCQIDGNQTSIDGQETNKEHRKIRKRNVDKDHYFENVGNTGSFACFKNLGPTELIHFRQTYEKAVSCNKENMLTMNNLRTEVLQLVEKCGQPVLFHEFAKRVDKISTELQRIRLKNIQTTQLSNDSSANKNMENRNDNQSLHQQKDTNSMTEVEVENFLSDITFSEAMNKENEQYEIIYWERWDHFIGEVKEKNPIISLQEQSILTEEELVSLLEKHGYNLPETDAKKSVKGCAFQTFCVSTEEDLHQVCTNFLTVNDENEQLLREVELKIHSLCDSTMTFFAKTEAAVNLFQTFEEKTDLSVDRLTLFTFLCSHYLSKVHAKQQKATEVDFQTVSDKPSDRKNADKLYVSNLKDEIEVVLLQLGKCLTDEEISILKNTLREESIQNYTHLPFNCTILQRLDIYFHSLLPAVSQYKMEHINNVVDDAKMFIIGKVLSKASFELGEEFSNLLESIAKDLKAYSESNVVVLHVSAWCIPLVSIKVIRDKEEGSFARSVERLANITFAAFHCKRNVASDELLADILCEEIESSLLRYIEDNWVELFICKTLTVKKIVFLKEAVIRKMLCNFCERNDFDNFVDLIQNYRHIGRGKFLKFIAEVLNEKENSLIYTVADDIIRDKIKQCLSALDETIEKFQTQEECNLATWLNIFLKQLSGYAIRLHRERHLDILIKCTRVHKFAMFTKQCERKVLELNSKLKRLIQLPPAGNADYTVTWFYEMPSDTYMKLIREIKGCTNQCPLCGAICEHGSQDHNFHRTQVHFPKCFNGHQFKNMEGSLNLDLTICCENSSNECQELMNEWEFVKETHELTLFWKYMIHSFSSQLQQFYKCSTTNIPQEWGKVMQSDALRSFKLGCCFYLLHE